MGRPQLSATGLLGELLAAVAAGFDGGQECRLHTKVVEGTERGRRRTARRGDVLAQHRRVGAGVAQELGRSVQGLGRESGRDVAGQPEQDAGVDHGLGDVHDVGGARAGDRRDGIEVLLGHGHDPADRGEKVGGTGEVLGGRGRAARHRRHALADGRGRVRHHAHDRGTGRNVRLEDGELDPGSERDHERAGRQRRGDAVERGRDVVRLDDDDDRLRPATAALLSLTTLTPYFSVISRCRSGRRSVPMISSGEIPLASRPARRFSPIIPTPSSAIVIARSRPRGSRRSGSR